MGDIERIEYGNRAGRTENRENQIPPFELTRAFDDRSSHIPVTPELLGGKGYHLVQLVSWGLPVPDGFTLTTDAWKQYHDAGHTITPQIAHEITGQIRLLEEKTGHRLGDPNSPFFGAVRSGSSKSMPGALNTILNVGLNDQTVVSLGETIGPAAALQAYFELIADIGTQIYHLDETTFTDLRQQYMNRAQENRLNALPPSQLWELIERAKGIFAKENYCFPQDPTLQLYDTVGGVFSSWDSPQAYAYREKFNISHNVGTAVTIQEMVWGNSLAEGAGSGVCITRNPITLGEPVFAFEPHAQGRDVVGNRAHAQRTFRALPLPSGLKKTLGNSLRVVRNNTDWPQDMEFVSDGKKISFVQTRDAPLSNHATAKQILTNIHNNKITEQEAIRRVNAKQLQALLSPDLDPSAVQTAISEGRLLVCGTPISPGNATGPAVFSIQDARDSSDTSVILLDSNITFEEITKLPPNIAGAGFGNGGIGSHISRVATKIGEHTPIVFGATIDRDTIPQGSIVTIDGNTGKIFLGTIPRSANGKTHILTTNELQHIAHWQEQKRKNPWRYVFPAYNERILAEFTQKMEHVRDYAQQRWQSPKAQTEEIFESIIRRNMEYIPVSITDTTTIRQLLTNIVTEGNDATLRCCFSPDRPGTSPWVLIESSEDIERFFSDPSYSKKHGGYPSWKHHENLTEVLVGNIPKGTLKENLASHHCSWTLSCTQTGDVVLQICPFTPHLRGHEGKADDDFITITAQFDPDDPFGLTLSPTKVGKSLRGNAEALEFAKYITSTVLVDWWIDDLPLQMAILAEVFPYPRYATPVLQGQAYIDPKKENEQWCLIYGINVDEVNSNVV